MIPRERRKRKTLLDALLARRRWNNGRIAKRLGFAPSAVGKRRKALGIPLLSHAKLTPSKLDRIIGLMRERKLSDQQIAARIKRESRPFKKSSKPTGSVSITVLSKIRKELQDPNSALSRRPPKTRQKPAPRTAQENEKGAQRLPFSRSPPARPAPQLPSLLPVEKPTEDMPRIDIIKKAADTYARGFSASELYRLLNRVETEENRLRAKPDKRPLDFDALHELLIQKKALERALGK